MTVLSAIALAGSTIAAPPAYHDAVDSAAPMLWYSLDEPAGNAVNRGSLGAGWNAAYFGTVTRGVGSPGGDVGVGLNQGDMIESLGLSPLTGNPTFSIEAVVSLSDPGNASLWGPLMHWGDGPSPRTGREVYFGIQNNNNRRLYCGFYNAGVRSQQLVPGDTWLHVVWTRAGGNNSEAGSLLYVNGALFATERDTTLSPGFLTAAAINVSASAFRINAGRDQPGARYFTGTLDEIAVYDRVLTPEEIAARAPFVACPSISSQPASASTCREFAAEFSVSVVGGVPGGEMNHVWQIEDPDAPGGWADMTDGAVTVSGLPAGTVSGAATAFMMFQPDTENAAFSQNRFRAVATNACGSATSDEALLTICACLGCPADFNLDGGIDGADVDSFFAAWEAGHCDADVNADGGVDGADVDTFFAAWEAGGCG